MSTSSAKKSKVKNLLAEDLEYILKGTSGLWEEIRGKRIFITGGTGFFGCWLLESFAWANDRLRLGARALVLSRNPEVFNRKAPHLAVHPAIQFHIGDIRDFRFPAGKFSHIIHAAAPANARLNEKDPLAMIDAIITGTRHTLDFALRCGAKKFLLTSSGAVYGRQPSGITRLPEAYNGAPHLSDEKYVYGEAKRLSELLCVIYAKQYKIEAKIARCFAFVGPYLPLGIHFAIGNFLQDALAGRPIVVKSDGRAHRSYLYAADLAIWLWTILFKAKSAQAYNVGSEIDMTISQAAKIVASGFSPALKVRINQAVDKKKPAERYVPSVKKAKQQLNLRQKILLPEAVEKTLSFLRRIET